MPRIISNPRASLAAGLGIAVVVLLVWIVGAGTDGLAFFSFLFRFLHVLAAMIWVGLIVFVNFIQLVALQVASDAERGFLHKAVVPNVAWWFRHASTATVGSGILLLVLTGYLLPSLVYGTSVYVPPARSLLMWSSVLGALVMWMFVHMYIWPSMQVVLGMRPGDADTKKQARARVILFARLNLIIAAPVVLAMVAAAHLY